MEPWEELARQLRTTLAETPPTGAPAVEGEAGFDVGATSVDVVIESSGSSAEEQTAGLAAICELMRTRRSQGNDQVLGCLLIDGEPLAAAYASGLNGMQTGDEFTPVIPLARERAHALLETDASLFELVDKSTALIEIASSRDPITDDVAATALTEIDELIERALHESEQ